jgi:hypothetical protein
VLRLVNERPHQSARRTHPLLTHRKDLLVRDHVRQFAHRPINELTRGAHQPMTEIVTRTASPLIAVPVTVNAPPPYVDREDVDRMVCT